MATIKATGPCLHGVADAICLHCTPMLLIGDRMRMTVELIRQIQDDWANGNVMTVRVSDITTNDDGTKLLWVERDEVQP